MCKLQNWAARNFVGRSSRTQIFLKVAILICENRICFVFHKKSTFLRTFWSFFFFRNPKQNTFAQALNRNNVTVFFCVFMILLTRYHHNNLDFKWAKKLCSVLNRDEEAILYTLFHGFFKRYHHENLDFKWTKKLSSDTFSTRFYGFCLRDITMRISILNELKIPFGHFCHTFLCFFSRYITMRISILNEPKNCVTAPDHDEEAILCTLFYDFAYDISP